MTESDSKKPEAVGGLWGIAEIETPEYKADQLRRNLEARAMLDRIPLAINPHYSPDTSNT